MIKVIRNTDYSIELNIIIGRKIHSCFRGIAVLTLHPMGTAPFNKTLEEILAYLDIDYLITQDLDIAFTLNDMVVPESISESDMTITAALEILTNENNKNS